MKDSVFDCSSKQLQVVRTSDIKGEWLDLLQGAIWSTRIAKITRCVLLDPGLVNSRSSLWMSCFKKMGISLCCYHLLVSKNGFWWHPMTVPGPHGRYRVHCWHWAESWQTKGWSSGSSRVWQVKGFVGIWYLMVCIYIYMIYTCKEFVHMYKRMFFGRGNKFNINSVNP